MQKDPATQQPKRITLDFVEALILGTLDDLESGATTPEIATVNLRAAEVALALVDSSGGGR